MFYAVEPASRSMRGKFGKLHAVLESAMSSMPGIAFACE